MNRRGSLLIISALALALFLMAPPVLAHGTWGWGRGMGPWMHRGPGGPWGQGAYPGLWTSPQMLEFMGRQIGLSPEQLRQLRAIVSEGQRERQKLQEDLWAARRDFRALMAESTLKEKEALAKAEEIGRVRTELLKATVNMRLKAEKVLTPKQRESLREFILGGYYGRRGWYAGMGPWMQGGPCGPRMGPGMMGPGMMGPGMMGPGMHGGPWGRGMGPWMHCEPGGPWGQGMMSPSY